MICDLCKREFEENEGRQACTACGFVKGCGGVRCPYCLYEMVPQPKWMRWLQSLRGGRKAEEAISEIASLPRAFRSPRRGSVARNDVNTQRGLSPSLATGNDGGRQPVCLPLTALSVHTPAEINHLTAEDPSKLKKLVAMGALPGSGITLLQRFPSYVFQIGWSQFSVDKELASSIFVKSVL